MFELNTVNIIGIAGAAIILILFILQQIGVLKNNSLSYDFWNMVGSGMMVYYALSIDSFPFLVLNLIWALVSLRDVVFYFLKK